MSISKHLLNSLDESSLSNSTNLRIRALTIDALAKYRNANNLGSKLNYLAELASLSIAVNMKDEASANAIIGQAISVGKPYVGPLS